MILVIVLSLIGVAGIIYGMVKKNRKIVIASVSGLIVLIILLLVYSYLYAQNPY